MDPAHTFAPLDGLAQAFEVQGGIRDPDQLRTDAGIYLQHDITEYLSRRQTYWVDLPDAVSTLDLTAAGAGQFALELPAGGLRFGRYLIACEILTTSIANLVGALLRVRSLGNQLDYPATIITTIGTYKPANATSLTSLFSLSPDPSLTRLPLWMPPGSTVSLQIQISANSGSYRLKPVWATTEVLSSVMQGTRTPVGVPQAAAKI